MFNGRLKITVIQAKGLQHTNFMKRHNMAVTMEPYVAIVVDDVSIERTSTKTKNHEPTWNETFTTDLLRNAEEVGFTVFHDATIPPDDFAKLYVSFSNCQKGYTVARHCVCLNRTDLFVTLRTVYNS